MYYEIILTVRIVKLLLAPVADFSSILVEAVGSPFAARYDCGPIRANGAGAWPALI
jgi:hypothetical protein